jgi:hypothetical protein
MAYYLGRDVKVMICTENVDRGISIDGSNELQITAVEAVGNFANELTVSGAGTGYALSDLTGVDLGIGVTDEDITYIGQRSVLKAEIKKETTVTLTKKKSDMLWDKVFNGVVKDGDELVSGTTNHGARWGTANNSAGAIKISNGLLSPKDHNDGTNVTFGYRVFVQIASGETLSIPCCQVIAHTISLNADGTTEETMEFISNITPFIGATMDVTRISNA